LLAALLPAHAESGATLSAAEKAALLRHGPWPPAVLRDASNRVSGKPAAIRFGEALFFDGGLSGNGQLSCATCHVPGLAFQDGLPVASGRTQGTRNTLSLFNLAFNRWFGWDGGNDNLWAQSIRPLLAAHEMDSSARQVATRVRRDPELRCRYRQAFGRLPPRSDAALLVDVGKALAAYQETLVTGRSPFDSFRDALAEGRMDAAYPPAALRGARLFVGEGRCNLCHFGPLFSNGEFADIGIPHFVPGGVDAGRHAGLADLRRSPYTRLGRWSDADGDPQAMSTRHVGTTHRNFGEFRVPSLRQVADTAPYMHNGSLATLADVVQHYSSLNLDRLHVHGEQILRPLDLSAAQAADLVAFLESLSGPADPVRYRTREDDACTPARKTNVK
jgi:cytochrome c peroxidase